ncbi:hypothetical protein FQA47_020295 [Oryzias melastigma]|uniref:Uncharacterized protein n=1 Tax=Oryzias melastigma TaxID=30732 RepID=A0A834FKY0_ORYME|nr:hypothetical protein FQA47_020295 [Oryzias melastigma]
MSCHDQPRLCGAYCDQFFRNAPPKVLVVIALIKVICYLIASLQFFPRKVCDSVIDYERQYISGPPYAKKERSPPFRWCTPVLMLMEDQARLSNSPLIPALLKPMAACAMWTSVQPQGCGGDHLRTVP